jgi:ferric-dicitrate binding protein FerR (iron transport regulator)
VKYARGGRQCASCKVWLPLDRFGANAQARDGLDSWCRPCHRAATRKWAEEHPDHVRAYRAARRPIENAQAREHWARNRDAINAKRRAAYAAARGVTT